MIILSETCHQNITRVMELPLARYGWSVWTADTYPPNDQLHIFEQGTITQGISCEGGSASFTATMTPPNQTTGQFPTVGFTFTPSKAAFDSLWNLSAGAPTILSDVKAYGNRQVEMTRPWFGTPPGVLAISVQTVLSQPLNMASLLTQLRTDILTVPWESYPVVTGLGGVPIYTSRASLIYANGSLEFHPIDKGVYFPIANSGTQAQWAKLDYASQNYLLAVSGASKAKAELKALRGYADYETTVCQYLSQQDGGYAADTRAGAYLCEKMVAARCGTEEVQAPDELVDPFTNNCRSLLWVGTYLTPGGVPVEGLPAPAICNPAP